MRRDFGFWLVIGFCIMLAGGPALAQDEAPTPTLESVEVVDPPTEDEAIPPGEALPEDGGQTGDVFGDLFGDGGEVASPDEVQETVPDAQQAVPTAPAALPQTGIPSGLGLGIGVFALMGLGSVSLLSIVFITRRERRRKNKL